MRRVLWLGIGLAVGALAVREVTRRAKAFTPGGVATSLRDSAAGLAGSVRTFVGDVREAMAEREAEIHAALTEGVTLEADWATTVQDGTPTEEGMRY
jgi:hypothetical protein